MKVVFLCGGTSKSVHPLTEDKVLLDLLGKTLLQHQIIWAQKAELNRFVIVGNPDNIDSIKDITVFIPGITVDTVVQKHPLGIADALETASDYLDEEILLINPNIIFDASVFTDLLSAKEDDVESYIFSQKIDNYSPNDYLEVDKNGYLKNIIEKPTKDNEPGNIVNVMIHMHSNPLKVLEYASNFKSNRDDVYKHTLSTMAHNGQRIKVLPLPGNWNEIKYPWHILDVVRRYFTQFNRYIAPTAQLSDKAIVEGKVIISNHAKVMENAVLKGPVYIGPNTVIDTGSLVRNNSHIGANCHIGFSTEINGSYIGDDNHFRMNYISDSVTGKGCNFGAGTVCTNHLFDGVNIKVKVGDDYINTGRDKLGAMIGNNCKIGINTSIMPGVKISPNSIVEPHSFLSKFEVY